MNELVVVNDPVTDVKLSTSDWMLDVKLLIEPVKALKELVVVNDPVWLFETYEEVADVKLSTSDWILEVKLLNELVVTKELVSNEPEGPTEPEGPVSPIGPVIPGVATCITLVIGWVTLTEQPSGLTTVILLLSGWILTVLTSEFIFIELLQDAILIGNLLG